MDFQTQAVTGAVAVNCQAGIPYNLSADRINMFYFCAGSIPAHVQENFIKLNEEKYQDIKVDLTHEPFEFLRNLISGIKYNDPFFFSYFKILFKVK